MTRDKPEHSKTCTPATEVDTRMKRAVQHIASTPAITTVLQDLLYGFDRLTPDGGVVYATLLVLSKPYEVGVGKVVVVPSVVPREQFIHLARPGIPPTLLTAPHLIPLVVVRLIDVHNGVGTVRDWRFMYTWNPRMPSPQLLPKPPLAIQLTQDQEECIGYSRRRFQTICTELKVTETMLLHEGALVLVGDQAEYITDMLGGFYHALATPELMAGGSVTIQRAVQH